MSTFYIWFPLLVTALIGLAVVIFEGLLRPGTTRKSAKDSTEDNGTTAGVAAAFIVSWLAVLLSILLNHFGIATIRPHWIFNIVGLVIMFAGITIRIVSARTLGRFYSRTLTTDADQQLVTNGFYRLVRHPGYLGTITLFVGSAIAVDNFVTVLVVVIAIFSAYVRRIKFEEQMLGKVFGQEFAHYAARTKKLIPFIY